MGIKTLDERVMLLEESLEEVVAQNHRLDGELNLLSELVMKIKTDGRSPAQLANDIKLGKRGK